jgi:hypothetical protein
MSVLLDSHPTTTTTMPVNPKLKAGQAKYRETQAKAKKLGLEATGKHEVLLARIAAACVIM